MTVYANTLFEGHWPSGVAAIVIANSPKEAALLLEIAIQEQKLPQQTVDHASFYVIDTTEPAAIILTDGSY